jgi:phosphoglucomutase
MTTSTGEALLQRAREGIARHLSAALKAGEIDRQLHDDALARTAPNIQKWLDDPAIDAISPNLKRGLREAIEAERWDDLINAFRRSVSFGTGGIRGMMAFDRESLVRLKEEGLDAPILKGPNTINNLVILLTSAGVARFGRDRKPPLEKVVVGYDTRVRGAELARIAAELFLAYGYTVYFFDEPCPYPEVTYAIANETVRGDIGVFVSASHNDYRYNGYKLTCGNGSQFDAEQRREMYETYIVHSKPEHVKLTPSSEAGEGRLWFLGGEAPVEGFDYLGREDCLIDIHGRHVEHVKSFIMNERLAEQQAKEKDPLRVGFCAFHGAGRKAVPRLLRDVGIRKIMTVTHGGLNDPDGLFPSFCSDPGKEQQPDPGDPRAARIAVEGFKKDHPGEFEKLDLLLGTDPDADRCGIVVRPPANQRHVYGGEEYVLLPADDMWTLLIWYRLQMEIEKRGRVQDADKKFLCLSHTTTDGIVRLARKHGIGVVRTWVGFAALAAATRDVWDNKTAEMSSLIDGHNERYKELCHSFVCDAEGMDDRRSFNIAALEQSNGFSLLGGRPPDERSMGAGGHVRDKDGTFAALLVAEVAAWAKTNGMSLIDLLDKKVYVDPDVGLYMTFYEPDPLDGEYPGIAGDKVKKAILRRALQEFERAKKGELKVAGRKVTSAVIYRTGKYDRLYPPEADFVFADEGVRLFFDADRRNHLTIRPSGTGNSLRFHIQLHAFPNEANLIETKGRLREEGRAIMDELRKLLDAPR